MKKQYIKPVVETLEMEEQMELLQSSIFTDPKKETDWLGSRSDNSSFAEDEDISGDDF
jgi:hypothetical protein